MTDKQLKKLSRLEVLELLLEQTKINEQLRFEIDELKKEISAAKSIDTLEELTEQMNNALENLAGQTRKIEEFFAENKKSDEGKAIQLPEEKEEQVQETEENSEEKPEEAEITIKEQKRYSNINLYSRLMYFYYKNDNALNALPEDIQRDVREKLRGILNGEKK